MKPSYLSIHSGTKNSFSSRFDAKPDINNMWHYHEELELIYIKKGSGTQFVGDSISNFCDGTIALLGSNLPHYWQFDKAYFKNYEDGVEVYVVHFKKDFLGRDFLLLPENIELNKTLALSEKGLLLSSQNSSQLGSLIIDVENANGTDKIILLLEALNYIVKDVHKKTLVSLGFKSDFLDTEKNRLQIIYNYGINNFRRKIDLKEIAGLVKLSESAFCKFFKSKTGKTFSMFLNELRVGYACKMLIEAQYSIKEICYMSGFYNNASFHKCFREIMGNTPLQYQKKYN